MPKIKFVTIKNHPNYEINRLGEIRHKKKQNILKPYKDKCGYLKVKLNSKNCRLHRLVAETFIPNPNNKSIVNHKRGIKTDCRASQLEWITQSENIKHAWETGLITRDKEFRKKEYRRK